jgi:adenine-specific DNA-methyltransferase
MPTLNWIGKHAVVNHHQQVPFHLLKDVPEVSCGDPGSGNLIVQGDNLVALKALLPYYAKQVKCIYIDPPYNTGNEDWIYSDNVDSPVIRRWLQKIVGREGEDLSRHDKWLCMVYPRLVVLRDFLKNDGVLLMSIDDNEVATAKFLLNEILGPQNFIAQLVWEKGRKNDAKLFSVGHEYILVYTRNRRALANTVWRAAKDGIAEIAAEYHRLRDLHEDDFDRVSKGLAAFYKKLPKGHPAKKYARAKNADKRGVWRDNNITWHGGGGPKYVILHPKTGKPCKVPEDGWRFVEESMKEKIADDPPWVVFRSDHKKPPFLKSYVYIADDKHRRRQTFGR